MSVENLGQQNENDPTKLQREALIAEIENLAEGDDKIYLEKFKKGVFFIPSETLNTVSKLIELVADEEKRKKLKRLRHEILSQD